MGGGGVSGVRGGCPGGGRGHGIRQGCLSAVDLVKYLYCYDMTGVKASEYESLATVVSINTRENENCPWGNTLFNHRSWLPGSCRAITPPPHSHPACDIK
jgi:hypothetical protein